LGIEILSRGNFGLFEEEELPLTQVLYRRLYLLGRLFKRELNPVIGLCVKQHFENVLALL
jgi:hypothetical protein